MSGTYQPWNQDAPGGIAETEAAIAAATAQAMADCGANQSDSAQFMAESGGDVVAGHGLVEGPGGAGVVE